MTSKHTILAIELEKEILAGKYGWQGGLPGTSELAQAFTMSINTVKNALALLEGKNLIEKRGIGYYVNLIPTVMTQYVPPAHIRLQSQQREGYCTNVGSVKKVALPDHLAEKLHYASGELVVYRVQVSGEIAEGHEKPMQISYRYHFQPLPDEMIQRMQDEATYDPMWNDASVPTELVTHDEVTVRSATESERNLLGLPESTSITNIFESIHDKDGNLFMAQEIISSPRRTLVFDFAFINHP